MSPERYWQGPEYWTGTDRVGRMGQLTERTWRRFIWILVFLSPLHSESGATSRREKHTAACGVTQHASTAQCLSVPCSYTLLLSKLHTISKVGWGWGWGVGWVLRGIIGVKLPFTDITLFSCDLHAQVQTKNTKNLSISINWEHSSFAGLGGPSVRGKDTFADELHAVGCVFLHSGCQVGTLERRLQYAGEEWPPLLHAVVPCHLVQQPVAVTYGRQVSTLSTLMRCGHHCFMR